MHAVAEGSLFKTSGVNFGKEISFFSHLLVLQARVYMKRKSNLTIRSKSNLAPLYKPLTSLVFFVENLN